MRLGECVIVSEAWYCHRHHRQEHRCLHRRRSTDCRVTVAELGASGGRSARAVGLDRAGCGEMCASGDCCDRPGLGWRKSDTRM